MHSFNSKSTGWLALLVGTFASLAVVSLLLMFLGFTWHSSVLDRMGRANDLTNGVLSVLNAILASVLHPALRKLYPRLGLLLLVGVWAGAISVIFGSSLIITGRAGVELSSYFYFFGNGLVAPWLWITNGAAREQAAWPVSLTRLGKITAGVMMLGLLGLVGILLGRDSDDYSPLLMVTGLSFLGIGILYPIWSLWLARWILTRSGR